MQLIDTPSIDAFVKPDTHSQRLRRRQTRDRLDRLDRRRARDERARMRRGTRAWLAEAYEDAAINAG